MNPRYVTANNFGSQIKSTLGISKVQFSPDFPRKLLTCCSWDGFEKIYAVTNQSSPAHLPRQDSSKVVSGGLDEVVKLCDLESEGETVMGQHSGAVRFLEFCTPMRVAVFGGWDNLVKLWDIRALTPVGAIECDAKVYALDVVDNRTVVGMKDRRVLVLDVRHMKAPQQTRESPLKYQTSAIRCFPSGEAFVLSSIEVRVAVEYFNQDADIQKSKYAYKATA